MCSNCIMGDAGGQQRKDDVTACGQRRLTAADEELLLEYCDLWGLEATT